MRQDNMGNDKPNEISRWEKAAFLVSAAVSFCLTIYLLINDKAASATVAGAFTIALLLFYFVPIVESFEVFGLKARLRHGVSEVDRLLGNISKTAEVSSKLLYIQLAWMNRMGTITWTKKRELLLDIDGLLRGVGISDDEIANLKQPFMVMISRDLHSIFEQFIRFRVWHHSRAIERESDKIFGGQAVDQNDPRYQDISERRKQWQHKKYDYEDILANTSLLDLDSLTKDRLTQFPFPDADLEKIEPIRLQIVRLAKECWEHGSITMESETFLNENSHPQDKLCKEIFGA